MLEVEHIRRRRLIEEAEGYLGLIEVLSDRFPLPAEVRDQVACRVLSMIEDQGEGEPAVEPMESAHALFLKGQAYRAMERYQEAVAPLEQSAALAPNNIHVYLALGWCLKRIGSIESAIAWLERSLAIEPQLAIVHYNLACYWSLSGEAETALDYLATALEIDSGYRRLIAEEPDFDPIRDLPEFRELTAIIV